MAVELTGKQFEETKRAPCRCGKIGAVTFSQNGVQPPQGWWVGVYIDAVRSKVDLAVACSQECLVAIKREKDEAGQAELAKRAMGIKVER